MHGRRERVRGYLVIGVLVVLGLGSAVGVISKQSQGLGGLPDDTYSVAVEVSEADGVTGGIGQPVNVAGVEVGTIARTRLTPAGNARLTLRIDRERLPRVHANASVVLEPVTPLKDMSIELDPGHGPAPALRDGATIGTDRARPPVRLSDILSSLDADTRAFLTTMIAGFDQGTRGRGDDLRAMLRSLGPTTAQARRISRELAARRRELARLVHNLARVTHAASRDRQLADVVTGGNRTLEAIARQDESLGEALARLPSTLGRTRRVLDTAATFSRELEPTVAALDAPARELRSRFVALRRLADAATSTLSRDVRPLVSEAQPIARDLGVAVPRLTALAPDMTSSLQTLNYYLNELAYNPPGDNEGFLYWLAWGVHNFNSMTSSSDAHAGIGRALVAVSCKSGDLAFREIELIFKAMIPAGACPPKS